MGSEEGIIAGLGANPSDEEIIAGFGAKVREHYPNPDIGLIRQAYFFAKEICTNGKTEGGRPFIMHPLGTAAIVAEMGGDEKAVAAALLHNTWDAQMHDAWGLNLTGRDIVERRFGCEVVGIIDEVLRESKAELGYKNRLSPSLQAKLLMAAMRDKRGFLVKIAARLDALREAAGWNLEKRGEIAKEAIGVFAPIAERLGIYRIKDEFEELGFKYLHPNEYAELAGKMESRLSKEEAWLREAGGILRKKISDAHIEAEITHRAKTLYSIYRKMERRGVGLEGIYDLLGLRVITGSVKDCYYVLGLVHAQWRHMESEFNDYIAKPKQNNYRAIHTTIIGPGGVTIEVQIRSGDMHRIAELGVAADWKYEKVIGEERYEKRLLWLKQLFEWERQAQNPSTGGFEIKYKGDVIVALTPDGAPIELPRGATVLDFAYAVHTDVGNRCSGAKVNGKMVPLRHALENLDVVEAMTSQRQKPVRGWLGIVKSEKARKKIRAALHMESAEKPRKGAALKQKVSIGARGQGIKLAKCCNPLPGDGVIGYRTAKRKISVHREGCAEAKKMGAVLKPVEVEWGAKEAGGYSANMAITAREGANISSPMAELLSKHGIRQCAASLKTVNNKIANYTFTIDVNDLKALMGIIREAGKIDGVIEVSRA
ncbi:MAG: HD domain-containing protein [Candidatus Diapherotrites archaeon]